MSLPKLPSLPVNIGDVLKENKEFAAQRSRPVHVAIFADPTAPADLIDAAKQAFVPQTPAGKLRVELLESKGKHSAEKAVLEPADNVVIILAGEQGGAAEIVREARSLENVHVAVLATAETDHDALMRSLTGVPVKSLVVGTDGADALKQLSGMFAKSFTQHRLALAANFPVFRGAVAHELIQAAAFQNAVVGVLPIIPGADMPVMTITQVRMLLQMAAAYNKAMDTGRLVESAVVVASAFLFRALAHTLLDFVPILGWAIKGVVGFSGTYALGMAALEYFKNDLDLYDMAQDIIASRKKAPEALPASSESVVGKTPSAGSGEVPTGVTVPANASVDPDAGQSVESQGSHIFRPSAFGTRRVREASQELGTE